MKERLEFFLFFILILIKHNLCSEKTRTNNIYTVFKNTHKNSSSHKYSYQLWQLQYCMSVGIPTKNKQRYIFELKNIKSNEELF